MRRRVCVVAVGLALTVLGGAAYAQVNVGLNVGVQFSGGLEIQTAGDFYQPLEPYGAWVSLPRYGRCWRPEAVSADWRPYTEGHWEWTDVGWYWVSDEPWAWATYHYGRWYLDPSYGWIWIPGTEWAPAWVDWRQSDDYVGWAPCGPVGFDIAPSWFCFVDIHRFHDHLSPRSFRFGDRGLYTRTRSLGLPRSEFREIGGRRERVYVNSGPRTDFVARATGTRFTATPITRVVEQTPVPRDIRQRPDSPVRHRVLDQQTENQWRERRHSSGGGANIQSSERRSPNGVEQSRTYPAPSGSPDYQRRDRRSDFNSGQTPGSSAVTPVPSAPSSPSSSTGRDRQRLYQNGQSRSYQEPSARTPTFSSPSVPSTPTGREQQRLYQQGNARDVRETTPRSSSPASVSPAVPQTAPPRSSLPSGSSSIEQPPRSLPQTPASPTGRSESRIYRESERTTPSSPAVSTPSTPLRPRAETPAATPRTSLPPSVRENPLPPTGHSESRAYENVPRSEPHAAPRAVERAAPQAAPHVSAPAPEVHAAPAHPEAGRAEERGKDRDRDH